MDCCINLFAILLICIQTSTACIVLYGHRSYIDRHFGQQRESVCMCVCVCANCQLPRVGGDSIHAQCMPVSVLWSSLVSLSLCVSAHLGAQALGLRALCFPKGRAVQCVIRLHPSPFRRHRCSTRQNCLRVRRGSACLTQNRGHTCGIALMCIA